MCGETKRPTLYLDWSALAVFSATDPLPLDPAMCITDTFGCSMCMFWFAEVKWLISDIGHKWA